MFAQLNAANPYIGGVALNQLTPAMVDKMFQQIIDKGLKTSTAAGAKRVLSVALSHARKYRYIETNAAKAKEAEPKKAKSAAKKKSSEIEL